MAKNITSREKDYSQWYLDIIRAAELADYAPVRGCMVVRPTGYSVWEEVQRFFDDAFKETGHVNAYFPLLIPQSFMEKEAEHVEGFAPEFAVVTHAGGEKLDEPLVIRPTSETIIGHMYSKWVQSWRDLPILINQWCNVMRWEKRPRLFLRTSEFLWQEGHTVHETSKDALDETIQILEIYAKVMRHYLALPVIPGEKTVGERFPGADNTYTCETMMGDKKALQAGTSHFLGQNFSKAFEIKFQSRTGGMDFAWTTSWGVSTRLIGAIIMTHSDNDGLVLPPRIAPVKAVIIPIPTDTEKLQGEMLVKAEELKTLLNGVIGGRYVQIDKQFHLRPGDRFFSHLQKGVPLRLELGEREIAAEKVRVVRRDTGEKLDVNWSQAVDVIPALLEEIQQNLFDRALKFRLDNTHQASNMTEFKYIIEDKGGFIEVFFAGDNEDERSIKEATGATPRCHPLGDNSTGKCFYTGKEGGRRTIFAKAY